MDWKMYRTWPPMKAEERAIIEDKLNRNSYSIYMILGILIMLCQLSMIIVFVFKPGGPFLSSRRSAYFCSYLFLFLMSGIMLVLKATAHRSGHRSIGNYLNYGYLICLCLWSTAVTLLDQLGGNSLAVFTYITLTAAVFGMMRLWQSILLFGGNFILLNCLLPYFPTPSGADQSFNNWINSFFISLFAFVISFIFYRNKIWAEHGKLIIEQQYQEIEQMNQILSQEVVTDRLTGAYNRRYMDERLNELLKRVKQSGGAACMMIDIDFFKQYNDTYGHLAGDHCLIALTSLLTERVKDIDACVIRYGGEEFLLFFFGDAAALVMDKAEEIQGAVRMGEYPESVHLEGHVTISIGVYKGDLIEESGVEDYIFKADQALYEAKRSGRNCIVEYRMNL